MVRKTTEEKLQALIKKHDEMQKALTLEFAEKYRDLMNDFVREKSELLQNMRS